MRIGQKKKSYLIALLEIVLEMKNMQAFKMSTKGKYLNVINQNERLDKCQRKSSEKGVAKESVFPPHSVVLHGSLMSAVCVDVRQPSNLCEPDN